MAHFFTIKALKNSFKSAFVHGEDVENPISGFNNSYTSSKVTVNYLVNSCRFSFIIPVILAFGLLTLHSQNAVGQCAPAGSEPSNVNLAPTCADQTTTGTNGVGSGSARTYTGLTAGVWYQFTLSNDPGNLSCREAIFRTPLDANSGSWFSIASTATVQAPAGTDRIRVQTTRSSDWNSTSAQLTYRVAAPTTASVGATQDRCGTLTSAALGGNTPTVGIGAWSQISGPGTSIFSNASSPSSTATAPSYGTYVYRWTISNGSCTASWAQITVNYTESANAGADQDRCATLVSLGLGGNAPTVGSGTWSQVGGSGSSTYSSTNANSPNAIATASTYGAKTYRWTVSGPNGGCSTSDDKIVNFTEQASAGADQDRCNTLTSAGLGGNALSIGSGAWSQVSGPGSSSFSPNNATPGATATATLYGTYRYRWTATSPNSTCSTTDDIDVRYAEQATVASAVLNSCATLTSPALGGNTPSVGSGLWSQISGPGTSTFSNASSGSSTATASLYGSYVYRWTITNGTCNTWAQVTVRYEPQPTISTAPTLDVACNDLTSTNLGGSAPLLGTSTGQWSQVSGPGSITTWSPSSTNNSPLATASTYGSYVLRWTVTNGTCTTSEDVTVRYWALPIISGPTTICDVGSSSYTNTLGLTTWGSTGGIGSVSSLGVLTPTPINPPTASSSGTVTVTNGTCTGSLGVTVRNKPVISSVLSSVCEGQQTTLSSDVPGTTFSGTGVSGSTFTGPSPTGNIASYAITGDNGGCVSDILILSSYKAVTANAGADQAQCSNSSFTLSGSAIPSGQSGTWSVQSGLASITSNPNLANVNVTVPAGDVSVLRYTRTNGDCEAFDEVTLTNAIPSTAATGINASINGDICAGVSTTLSLTGGSLGTGASWQWYSASCGGTPEGTGTSVVKSPTTNTTYFVRAEGTACPPTACQSIVVTAKPYSVSGTPILSATGSSTANGACLNSDGYIYYFLDPNATPGDADDRLMFAMNHNGNNLGTVNVTLDLTPGAGVFPPAQPSSPYCPSVSELHLGRVWDVTTGNQPVSPVNCRFYFLDTEFSTFAADAATENTSSGGTYGYCYGVPTVLSDLMMTVEHSSSLELFNPLSVAGGPQAGSQQVDFSLSEFSRGFLHSNGGIHGANPLPVTYLYIEANAVDNSFIRLNWATATEINNSGFEVQRSVDGVNWNAIGWVAGNNNSTTQINYNYSDYNVEPNTRYYYRLKQIDNDGDFEISTVVSAIISGTQTIGSVSVIPNPSNGMVQVRITSTVATEAKITLTDVLGRNVSESMYPLSKGLNTSNFDWSLVAEGTYTLTLTSANEVRSVKLIITK